LVAHQERVRVSAHIVVSKHELRQVHSRAEKLVVKPLGIRIAASFIGAFLSLVTVAIVSSALPATVGGLVAVVGVPLVGLAGYRGFRISLVADPDRILVKNYFRTYRVRWENVQAIGLGFHQMGGVLGDAVAISLLGRRLVITVQATLGGANERRRALEGLIRMRPDLQIRFSG
jgi:hypothetical protein